MKGNVSASNPTGIVPAVSAQVVRTSQHQAATYQKAYDERKRPLRGLWVRNGRYYAQMTVEDPHKANVRMAWRLTSNANRYQWLSMQPR